MIQLLLTYKYFIVVPLSIIEGPIITVICGFLVTLKVFNPIVVYIVIVIGDIVGDAMVYYIGYKGKKYLHFLRISETKIEAAKQYFKDNHKKALVASKLAHGIGFTGLMAAGASRVPYIKYFKTCAIVSVVQSAILFVFGVLFGHAYLQIGRYLNDYAGAMTAIVLIVALFFIIRKYKMGIKVGP